MANPPVLFILLALARFSAAEYFGDYQCGSSIDASGYSGTRDVIVHLFEWKWSEIAAECERFLGPKGFCSVQVSPPMEHRVYDSPWRPWWQRYQPVSYILSSRSGDRNAFSDMLYRCAQSGVRIYVDAVINHMTLGGYGTGSGGSAWSGDYLTYPSVPYGSYDINYEICPTYQGSQNIENYQDPNQVRNCRLGGLRDLKLGTDYVRGKVCDYMNDLISLGVAGFRIDASKHMWPGDVNLIYPQLWNLTSNYFGGGKRPYIYQEVIDMGGEPVTASQYTSIGRVTEFKYCKHLADCVFKNSGQKLAYLHNFGELWDFMGQMSAVVFVDNHDNQRGHGGGGSVVTYKNSKQYKIATAFALAWSYGQVRMMSSYDFTDSDAGPPSDANGTTDDVPINPDGSCGGGWICEHRWRQLTNMVGFHNLAIGQPIQNWWDNGNNQIAFSRGNLTFIAMNNDGYDLNQNLYTGLESGTYCDVISGDVDGTSCTGNYISVDQGGFASIYISGGEWNNPVIAITTDSKVG